MDQEASTSRPCLSPPRKRPPVPFRATEKLMIRNVFKYVYEEKAAECLKEHDYKMSITSECCQKTADILGISIKTVYGVLKEHKENYQFKDPRKVGPKKTFKDKYSDADFEGIRRIIQQFTDNNEAPTINKVHRAVMADPSLPKMSRTTMMHVMRHIKNTKTNSVVPSSNNNEETNEVADNRDPTDVIVDTEIMLVEVKCEYTESDDDSS